MLDVWRGLEQSVISDAINEWRDRANFSVNVFMPKEDILSIYVEPRAHT